MAKTWKDVDWVELGCRGWDIDETGAELADPAEDLWVNTRLTKTRITDGFGKRVEGPTITAQRTERHIGEIGHAHLDLTTLHLILSGPPDFVERAIRDLRAANALTPMWTWANATTGSTATGTITVYAAWPGRSAWGRPWGSP